MQETQVWSLGQEEHLEKEMATHSVQYSCLGNPMNRGAWWATVHGVRQESDTTQRHKRSQARDGYLEGSAISAPHTVHGWAHSIALHHHGQALQCESGCPMGDLIFFLLLKLSERLNIFKILLFIKFHIMNTLIFIHLATMTLVFFLRNCMILSLSHTHTPQICGGYQVTYKHGTLNIISKINHKD